MNSKFFASPFLDETPDSTASRQKKKRILLVATVVALVFLIGREAGFVNCYLFNFKAQSKTESDPFPQLDLSFRTVFTDSTAQNTRYGLGFHLSSDSPLFVDLRDEVKKRLKEQTQTSFTVDEATLTGSYWVPLLKSGSAQYRVRFEHVGNRFTVVLKGKTDFECSGITSIRMLKQSLAEEITTRLIKTLEDVTRG